MTPQVDGYIRKQKRWQQELKALRAIVLDSPLTEDVKWRAPCYTLDGANVLMLGAFKDYCCISFLKGSLMKDPKHVLQSAGPNSQAVRLVRFTTVDEVEKLAPTLKRYIAEAIALEKSGAKVELKPITEHAIPEELQAKLDEFPALKKAFESLTPGRRRAYYLHIGSAKQSATRAARVEKHIPRILQGKGIDDD